MRPEATVAIVFTSNKEKSKAILEQEFSLEHRIRVNRKEAFMK